MTVTSETLRIASEGDAGDLIAGRYRVAARVGDGGMAAVYRAHDEVLGRDVALKVFRRELASGEDLQRQQSEIRILARLSHPSLVTLFDAVSEDEGRGVLVLEYVDGTDLRRRLGAGPLPGEAVAAIGVDIARALAYIHGQGVIHRDVSPANVLLPASPATTVAAKLTDLGIARLVDDGRLTATGSVVGTAGYMSPEQTQGLGVSAASDVYSLGLVLLECLTGAREFPGNAVESATARLARDPRIPSTLPTAWRHLLRSMTARAPERRPTAIEVADGLAGLLARGVSAAPLPDVAQLPTAPIDVVADAATRKLPRAPVAAPATPDPTAAVPEKKAPRRRTGLVIVMTVIVVALAAVATVLVLAVLARSAHSPEPSPSYPAVSGQLGQHLKQLEQQVAP